MLARLISLIAVTGLAFANSVTHAEPTGKSTNTSTSKPTSKSTTAVKVPKELSARFYVAATELSNQLLVDYQKVLEVYYELKKKSPNPNLFPNYSYDPNLAATLPESVRGLFEAKTIETLQEFDFELYREFQKEFDTRPELKNNTFLARMREYGSGRANDVFQRIGTYTFEKAEFAALEKDLHKAVYRSVGNPVMSFGMQRSLQMFTDISKQNGYLKNGSDPTTLQLEHWHESLTEIEKDLGPQLKKLGFKSSLQSWLSCQDAFAKIAK